MALELARVHVYARQRDPATGEVRQTLVEHNPILRLRSGDDPPVFIQRGQMYSENGRPLLQVPDWVETELAKCTPHSLAAVGMGRPPHPETPHTSAPAQPLVDPSPGADVGQILQLLRQLDSRQLQQMLQSLAPDEPNSVVEPLASPSEPAYMQEIAEDGSVRELSDDDDVPDPVSSLLPAIPGEGASSWTCEACGKSMPRKHKGFHIANHKREQAKEAS